MPLFSTQKISVVDMLGARNKGKATPRAPTFRDGRARHHISIILDPNDDDSLPVMSSTFEAVRGVTGWKRHGGGHGCEPVEVVPGLWTAHYHDIDSKEKLDSLKAPIRIVVNSALCSCGARTGFFGPDVTVFEVELEDDPDERKKFDAGKTSQSKCGEDVPLVNRCAGDVFQYFEPVCDAIDEVLGSGGHALVHCHASISRSAALILAYLMRAKRLSLLDATKLLKSKWNATWPCDRFVFELLAYERHLAAKGSRTRWIPRYLFAASAGFALAALLFRRG